MMNDSINSMNLCRPSVLCRQCIKKKGKGQFSSGQSCDIS